jgi:tryptophanyl-tRNA synthetase
VKASMVPVGKDNVAHVEVTREIARRFNHLYGEVFPEPDVLVGEVPTLVGLDGNAKMSKSLDNAIYLSDDAATVTKKIRSMYTDPNRLTADVPGRVEGNPVFIYHDAFNTDRAEVEDLKQRYAAGRVGDVEVKEKLTKAVNGLLEPMREVRARVEQDKGRVEEIILAGTEKVREIVKATVFEMRKAMGLAAIGSQLRRRVEKRAKKTSGD